MDKVTSFSDSDNSHRIRIYETTEVAKGYKYRVVTKVTAIHNGDKESKTIISSEQKILNIRYWKGGDLDGDSIRTIRD